MKLNWKLLAFSIGSVPRFYSLKFPRYFHVREEQNKVKWKKYIFWIEQSNQTQKVNIEWMYILFIETVFSCKSFRRKKNKRKAKQRKYPAMPHQFYPFKKHQPLQNFSRKELLSSKYFLNSHQHDYVLFNLSFCKQMNENKNE